MTIPTYPTIPTYLTPKEYSQLHSVHESTVRNWCMTGALRGAYSVGGRWRIPGDTPPPDRNEIRARNATYANNANNAELLV